jgi:hypothetical protein
MGIFSRFWADFDLDFNLIFDLLFSKSGRNQAEIKLTVKPLHENQPWSEFIFDYQINKYD